MLRSKLLYGAAIVLALAATAGSASATFTTFDPKGSVYTYAVSINGSGTVAGYYHDANHVTHGFLRTSDGTITAIDPAGSTATVAASINANGDVAGWYRDKSGVFYSFVRASDGTITTFNPTKGYQPSAIGLNANGNVAGWYSMGNQSAGFVGAPGGKIKPLTVEGVAINSKGAVTGFTGSDGFVRSPYGKTVTFVGPGSPRTTTPTGINDYGMVAGYAETICGISQGFARDSHGTMTTIAAPNSYYTWVMGINSKDALTGYYYYGGYHGFVRDAGGSYTTFDIPGAAGTYPQSINTNGEVTGGYLDAAGQQHGFVGTP